jgi:hypothetical protein
LLCGSPQMLLGIKNFMQNSPSCQSAFGYGAVPGASNILFGDSIILEGMFVKVLSNTIEYKSIWRTLTPSNSACCMGVHVLDENGTIVRSLDHELVPMRQIGSSVAFTDTFTTNRPSLAGASNIGIAIFRKPDEAFMVKGGKTDWDNHRLLLRVQEFIK